MALQQPERVCLLIADISGYTSYLAGVELDHAQDIIADLVGTVVTALRPDFRLAKLEGDAAFMEAPADALDGSMLLDTIERCYFGFRRRRRDVRQASACDCNACVRTPDLNLKFVVHHGQVLRQQMAGLEELIGSDVILVHRLLKNSVEEDAYVLLTQATIDATELEPMELGMRSITETYEHIGDVPAWVHDLERRWAQEEERQRAFQGPDDAMLDMSVESTAPPQVAWDFLTAPGQRQNWQFGVTGVEVEGATGGRRGPGATNHCLHGKDVVLEEILDWRPYDYVTDRTIVQTPGGVVRVLHTVELEPTTTGTRIHFRFGWPESAEEKAAMKEFGPWYRDGFQAALPELASLLAGEAAQREADRPAEPELPLVVGRTPIAKS
jgi:uncharacterized protein YndB with AHSA1/START domain/class 3 adenylate cyclase